MKKTTLLPLILLCACTTTEKQAEVTFNDLPAEKKVEIFVDSTRFTDFIYPDDLEKQALWPIYTASGTEITRGFPRAPRPLERTDHPHHVGMWFNFGEVNGLDFWNNSYDIAPEKKHRYGSIRFRGIVEQDPAQGKLVVASEWVNSGDTVLLDERTTYIFSGRGDRRTIERTSELTARMHVVLTENKEGLLGLRMDRAFEAPARDSVTTTGLDGTSSGVRTFDNTGVNGMYRNALGDTAAAVWGKRSPWVALRAEKDGEPITVAILDHPANPGYPAWSHARDYGLFAANNLGGRAFDKGADELKITLEPGEKLTFKHRVLLDGALTDEELNALAGEW